MRDIHQTAKGKHAKYFCTGSTNGLWIVDEQDERLLTLGGDGDASIVNSCYPDGDFVWVVKHNRDRRPSEIVRLKHWGRDLVVDEIYRTPDFGIHNVHVEGGRIYYNASIAGEIVRLEIADYESEDIEVKLRMPWMRTGFGDMHVKGMGDAGEHLIVGVSEDGDIHTRFNSHGHLVFVNKETLERDHVFSPRMHKNEPIGNINEIVVIST